MPLETVFLLSTDCGLLCVYRWGRVVVSGLVSLANRTLDVRMQETHMGKRMEEADLYHCSGLSKLLRTPSHLPFKFWSLVGNILSSFWSFSLAWLTLLSQFKKEVQESGRGTWKILRLKVSFCFCTLAHATMILIHNRLYITFQNLTLFSSNPGYFLCSAEGQIFCL